MCSSNKSCSFCAEHKSLDWFPGRLLFKITFPVTSPLLVSACSVLSVRMSVRAEQHPDLLQNELHLLVGFGHYWNPTRPLLSQTIIKVPDLGGLTVYCQGFESAIVCTLPRCVSVCVREVAITLFTTPFSSKRVLTSQMFNTLPSASTRGSAQLSEMRTLSLTETHFTSKKSF